MRYTTLRVTEDGVVFFDLHARRLAPDGGPVLEAFERFARESAPGVFALSVEDERLLVEPRVSRMHDGIPVRWMRSPFCEESQAFAKPAPPNAYEQVRLAGVATLLTSRDGSELLESCTAAVIGWDGDRFVCVPDDRPRVRSVSEAALRGAFGFRLQRLAAEDRMPLALLNAVKGPCRIDLPGREPFPEAPLRDVEKMMLACASRGR